jgi:hypothetical protein
VGEEVGGLGQLTWLTRDQEIGSKQQEIKEFRRRAELFSLASSRGRVRLSQVRVAHASEARLSSVRGIGFLRPT